MPDRVLLSPESANTPQHVGLLATFALPAGTDPAQHVRWLPGQLDAAPVVAPFTFRPRHARWAAFDGTWEVLAQEDVDRSHHLRRSALPAPGGERELLELVSRTRWRGSGPSRGPARSPSGS